MNVIKSTDGDLDIRVRALGAESRVPTSPAIDPAILDLRRQVETMTQELSSRDAGLAKLRSEVVDARREGMALGRKAGVEEGQACAQEALSRLQEGLATAMEHLTQDMASMEQLAAALAKEGLAKILGDSASHATLVTQIIRTQVAQLEAQAILRVEVSLDDFPDPEALTGLALPTGTQVEALPELAPGDCRIKLRLGVLEVGPSQQWSRLSAILDDLIRPEAPV